MKAVRMLGTAVVAILVAAVGTSASAGTAVTPEPAYLSHDYSGGNVYSVLPPGENGLVTGSQLLAFEAGQQRPANSNDQLLKYAGLLYGAPKLTDATLLRYYDRETFGISPGQVVRTEHPSASVPVAIYRDRFDVPHIYGASVNAMEFGAGYAGAEDRLFLMDVLRHYGEGTLSAFLGPSCANEQLDHDQLLLTGYTPAERQAQLASIARRYGALGDEFVHGLGYYVAGINAYIAAARTNPGLLPADYSAALAPPQPWTPGDVVSIAGLVGGIFGRGGGGELANARLVQYLDRQLGTAATPAAFTAFKDQNDPSAPTTIRDKTFPYEIPGIINPATTAMPADAAAPLTGGPTDTTANCSLTAPDPTALEAVTALLTFPSHLSNALLVDAAHSASGHPLAVFGPQVGYFAPEILQEEDLHAPDFAAEGASFAGTSAVVELGRGEDYAWSATSAGTDNVDTRFELICSPHGGKPATQGTYYKFDGRCLPMSSATFTETALTKPGGLGAPVQLNHLLHYTRHGVVQGWTTATDGRPVAVVLQRSTYGHELDSGIGFLRWNIPSQTHDVASWMRGARDISYTFNWFYLDNRDIGYYVSGADPVRRADVNPNLPVWGTGTAEWQGLLAADAHPHEVNPPQGYFTSWNNKPAPGFSASDAEYGYGPVYRSQSLDQAIATQFRDHRDGLTQADLVQAMESAATVDLSAAHVLPELFASLGRSPEPDGVSKMLGQLRSWVAAGAHRIKADPAATQYTHAAAVASMDELYPKVLEALFDPLFAAGGTYLSDGLPYGYSVLPMAFANTPNSQGSELGSAYDGGWEGYLVTLLRQLRHAPVADAFPATVTSRLCPSATACLNRVRTALLGTYAAMVRANGGRTDAASWTADSNTTAASAAAGHQVTLPQYDAIAFRAVGVVGQPDSDWQNRPTFQQVVMFPRHRPRE